MPEKAKSYKRVVFSPEVIKDAVEVLRRRESINLSKRRLIP